MPQQSATDTTFLIHHGDNRFHFHFLDRIATHILAAEGDSQWSFFAGNYQEYEADKKKRLGEEGARPKRLRFKPLAA